MIAAANGTLGGAFAADCPHRAIRYAVRTTFIDPYVERSCLSLMPLLADAIARFARGRQLPPVAAPVPHSDQE